MTEPHTPLAYCSYRSGAGGVRPVPDAAEAERILKGGYGILTTQIELNGEVIGQRIVHDGLDDRRSKYFWSYDRSIFEVIERALGCIDR